MSIRVGCIQVTNLECSPGAGDENQIKIEFWVPMLQLKLFRTLVDNQPTLERPSHDERIATRMSSQTTMRNMNSMMDSVINELLNKCLGLMSIRLHSRVFYCFVGTERRRDICGAGGVSHRLDGKNSTG